MIGRNRGGSRPLRRPSRGAFDEERAGSAEAARTAALRLLESRDRTRLELERRLGQRGFEPGAVAAALDRLAEVGLVDDQAVATRFAEGRAAQGVDATAIATELRDRGIDAATASRAAEAAAPAEERIDRCRELAEARLAKLTGLSPEAQFRRLAAYLTRRGYPPDMVETVTHDLVDLEQP